MLLHRVLVSLTAMHYLRLSFLPLEWFQIETLFLQRWHVLHQGFNCLKCTWTLYPCTAVHHQWRIFLPSVLQEFLIGHAPPDSVAGIVDIHCASENALFHTWKKAALLFFSRNAISLVTLFYENKARPPQMYDFFLSSLSSLFWIRFNFNFYMITE